MPDIEFPKKIGSLWYRYTDDGRVAFMPAPRYSRLFGLYGGRKETYRGHAVRWLFSREDGERLLERLRLNPSYLQGPPQTRAGLEGPGWAIA
jgi:hypothetical protein